jgi:hypothetical protein
MTTCGWRWSTHSLLWWFVKTFQDSYSNVNSDSRKRGKAEPTTDGCLFVLTVELNDFVRRIAVIGNRRKKFEMVCQSEVCDQKLRPNSMKSLSRAINRIFDESWWSQIFVCHSFGASSLRRQPNTYNHDHKPFLWFCSSSSEVWGSNVTFDCACDKADHLEERVKIWRDRIRLIWAAQESEGFLLSVPVLQVVVWYTQTCHPFRWNCFIWPFIRNIRSLGNSNVNENELREMAQ